MIHNLAIVVVLCALAGCGGWGNKPGADPSATHPGAAIGSKYPDRPLPIVSLQPADLMTEVGETPIRAWIYNYGAPVPESLLSELSKSVNLVEYPGGTPVPFAVVTYNPQAVRVPEDSRKGDVS